MGFETVQRLKVGDLDVAFREEGEGPPRVLVHGWPLSSLTWRKVVPELAASGRCLAIDLAGAGESVVDPERNLGLRAQSSLVCGFVDALGLERVTLIGHDSGGSIARAAAIAMPDRVEALVLADTEVPGHRPWFVVALQRLGALPGGRSLLGPVLGSQGLARSPFGFGLCFGELRRFDFAEFHRVVVAPGAASERARRATLRFLHDFDFAEVDAARARYEQLSMPKLVLWGERDRIFPLAEGRRLAAMLPDPVRFETIPGAGLFVHEERPEAWTETVRALLPV